MRRIVAGALLAAGVLSLAACGADTEDAIGAEVMCRNHFVKDQLKWPDSADFGDTESTEIGEQEWQVNGDVQAEDSFGGTVHYQYDCRVHYEGDDMWRLTADIDMWVP